MNTGRTIFSPRMDFFPLHEFRQCVERYHGHYQRKSFSCGDPFLCLAFAQLTYRESLRDIQACLRATQQRLSHRGIRGKVSRNTLAHANQVRDWRIYADLAQVLLRRARELYAHEPFGLELDQAVSAWDATVIDLCLSLFPWAKFRRHQGAGKLHTLLDLRGHIPTIVFITHGKVHEVNLLDRVPLHFGWDFARLYRIHPSSAFFVIRAKGNFRFKRLYSQPVDQSEGVPCDPILLLPHFYPKEGLPEEAAAHPVL
jgi:hypothetical protein